MVESTDVQELQSALDAVDDTTVLAAAWDAFDLAIGIADGVTWQGGDELQAMAAAAAGSTGRALLPLPATSGPREVPAPAPGPEALEPYIALMRHTHTALLALADSAHDATTQASLREAAGHALAAAGALTLVWEQ
ncbi:hypothetical protein [Streptomyces pristinaespiralis]|uniref:hypothetical protein n=1 Tax=Streptomyces pristinaespiralis TaxID=38300 RepID=UPI0033CC4408